MADIREKIFLQIRDLIFNAIDDLKANQFQKYVDEAADSVKIRTRLGYGVEGIGKPRQKLKELSTRYKKERKKLKERGELSEKTSVAKSNLTKSGQMIDAIYGEDHKDGTAVIAITDRRTDRKNNSDLVKWNAEKGRPFFTLTDLEIKKIKDSVRKDLTASVTRALRFIK